MQNELYAVIHPSVILYVCP